MTTMAVALDKNLFLAYYSSLEKIFHHVLHLILTLLPPSE